MPSICGCSTPSGARRTPPSRSWRHKVGIARGTVYSRIDRLEREGVVTGYGPDIDVVRAGLSVLAFTVLEIAQGSHDSTIAALVDIHEIVEIHTITGKATCCAASWPGRTITSTRCCSRSPRSRR